MTNDSYRLVPAAFRIVTAIPALEKNTSPDANATTLRHGTEPGRVRPRPDAVVRDRARDHPVGFIFNAYVTLTNATREGTERDRGHLRLVVLQGAERPARNEFIKTSLLASMNLLVKTSPNPRDRVDVDAERGHVHERRSHRDLPAARRHDRHPDARVGYQITVRATYHQDLVIPLIPQFRRRI